MHAHKRTCVQKYSMYRTLTQHTYTGEGSPENPNSFISIKSDVGLLACSASRRSKTGQEAPKTAPGRPKKPPREPQDGLIASEKGVRGADDGSRAPEDGPKEAQEGGRKPNIKTFRPKRPTRGPKRPARGSKRPPNCPHRGPKRRPDRPEQGLKMLQTCFEETPRCFPIYRGTVHKSYPIHIHSHWYGCTYPCRTYVSGRSACLPIPQFTFARSVGAYIRAAVALFSKAGVG